MSRPQRPLFKTPWKVPAVGASSTDAPPTPRPASASHRPLTTDCASTSSSSTGHNTPFTLDQTHNQEAEVAQGQSSSPASDIVKTPVESSDKLDGLRSPSPDVRKRARLSNGRASRSRISCSPPRTTAAEETPDVAAVSEGRRGLVAEIQLELSGEELIGSGKEGNSVGITDDGFRDCARDGGAMDVDDETVDTSGASKLQAADRNKADWTFEIQVHSSEDEDEEEDEEGWLGYRRAVIDKAPPVRAYTDAEGRKISDRAQQKANALRAIKVHSSIERAKGFLPTEQALLRHAIRKGIVIDDGDDTADESSSGKDDATSRQTSNDAGWVSEDCEDLHGASDFRPSATESSSSCGEQVIPMAPTKKVKKRTKRRGDQLRRTAKDGNWSSTESSSSSADDEDLLIPEPVPPRPIYIDDLEDLPGIVAMDSAGLQEPFQQLDWERREQQPDVVRQLNEAGQYIFASLLEQAHSKGVAEGEANMRAFAEEIRRQERQRCMEEVERGEWILPNFEGLTIQEVRAREREKCMEEVARGEWAAPTIGSGEDPPTPQQQETSFKSIAGDDIVVLGQAQTAQPSTTLPELATKHRRHADKFARVQQYMTDPAYTMAPPQAYCRLCLAGGWPCMMLNRPTKRKACATCGTAPCSLTEKVQKPKTEPEAI